MYSIFHQSYGHTISEANVVPTYTTAKFPAAAGQVCQAASKSCETLVRRRFGMKSDNRQIYDSRGIIRRKQTWQIYQYSTYRTFAT